MKTWLILPLLALGACANIDEDTTVEAAPLRELHGIRVPFERVREKPDKSQGAFVGQVVGADTWVQISYHRPGARGRDVWTATNGRGDAIVPAGGDPTPWRAGANEPTLFTTSGPILLEDRPLAAGRYVLMFEPGEGSWTLILQDAEDNPGAYGYDRARDVLRVPLRPRRAPHEEWMRFGFDDTDEWTATAFLHWAELKVPFRIGVQPVREN